MQVSSEAVQSTNGVKKLKSQAQNIPDVVAVNPMAPAPKQKAVRCYGKANAKVYFTFFWIAWLLMTPYIANGSGARPTHVCNASTTSSASQH